MNELYWIGRCAIVNEIAGVALIAGLIAAVVLGIIALIVLPECDLNDKKWDNIRSLFKKITIVCAFSALFYAFVPSQKEMFLILGIGGTIDYLQSNEKAMQIPDKCIDAIDAWVESLVEEKEK